MIGPNFVRTRALPIGITRLTERDLVAVIHRAIELRSRLVITYATAHTLAESWRSEDFANAINETDLCYADGAGVVVADRLIERVGLSKLTANTFFVSLAAELIQGGKRIALIGAADGIADEVAVRVSTELSRGGGVGHSDSDIFTHSGYMSDDEACALVSSLREWDPHIVFVGMGQPRQERWALQVSEQLPSTVFFCVGGLFDYVSGRIGHPPMWVRNAGFEWLFRLIDRPRETWRRYLIGLPRYAVCTLLAAARRVAQPLDESGGEGRP